MAILDSTDKVAGTSAPGPTGGGFNAQTSCISGNNDSSSRCKSENGALSGIEAKSTTQVKSIIPLGTAPKMMPIINPPRIPPKIPPNNPSVNVVVVPAIPSTISRPQFRSGFSDRGLD